MIDTVVTWFGFARMPFGRDLPPSRLTMTFGFGAGVFGKEGKDRYGVAAQRPPALVDLPSFNGDELIEARTGGDLLVQACADEPQVAFHAVRQLARLFGLDPPPNPVIWTASHHDRAAATLVPPGGPVLAGLGILMCVSMFRQVDLSQSRILAVTVTN